MMDDGVISIDWEKLESYIDERTEGIHDALLRELTRKKVLTNLLMEGSFFLFGSSVDLSPRDCFLNPYRFMREEDAEEYAKAIYGDVNYDVHVAQIKKIEVNK